MMTTKQMIDTIRDEVRRCGFTPDMAYDFAPRRIVGDSYLASEEALRAEVRYWVQRYTDTSGT